ncbi:MAG TPA: 1,4-alpha-glucan branching protein GlgB [Anaerolineales bacterium]|jgi:1,4-alpha-glucan branching enzyme
MAKSKRSGSKKPEAKPVAVRTDVNRLTDDDLFLFNEGSHFGLQEKLGSHPMEVDGQAGTYFAVWAPNADYVSVVGDFNEWDRGAHPLSVRSQSGIWHGFVPGVGAGQVYKYHIASKVDGYRADKADPFARYSELPPRTASLVWDMEYEWGDQAWMRSRHQHNSLEAPISVYEMHLGSWQRLPEEGNRSLSYRELAPKLIDHLGQLGVTHVEFLPVMEHPFAGSWGYQTTGYFAPTSRFGSPQDFMYLVDQLHQAGYGVILDWVPSHFPTDEHGLAFFDGTHLLEHADPRQGYHPDWGSYIFNYGRDEVRSFLISSALYWLDKFHVDGLRVDAVASMLYLDYSREQGKWIPNRYGGRENLEAIEFLRRLNTVVYERFPDVQMIAEESTAWPMVSRPIYLGGLGFGMKWDMGWMHDTLEYMIKEPVHRKYHHKNLTFRLLYAFQENFMLALSHDEVVHGKGSLLNKMPGDDWQKFANLRALYGYMYAQPGKKLFFMGDEFGQRAEWNHDGSLEWHLLEHKPHRGLMRYLQDLNQLYRQEPALHAADFEPEGFAWLEPNDWEQSVISFFRREPGGGPPLLIVANFTPVVRHNYRLGVPQGGRWLELNNSDAKDYYGSGQGNLGSVEAAPLPSHGHPYSLTLTVPPLGVLYLKPETQMTADA